ncbi:ethanolamine kinase 1-like isoform X2 [Protopterus annectens]|uniref:ethanolamine kinase 1-like isoform X2 n=1 Tax=Protopterus annectens TaxID=7888 RepID=UPI001CFC0BFB|nr:ethanolamine kinase 1-like isoform X2 [Protopterus annectens]
MGAASHQPLLLMYTNSEGIIAQRKRNNLRQVFQFFTDGITNKLLGCYTDESMEDVILVRVYGNMTELFVDRENEVKSFQVLHAHGCAPELYCTFQNGICYQFVKGTVLDKWLVREPSIYRLVAKEMARIHSIKPEQKLPLKPVIWKKLSSYMNLLEGAFDASPERQSIYVNEVPAFDILSKEIEALKNHLSNLKSPVVLCHNDLLCKNIIYNEWKGFVRFIDYEYTGYNYQAYDIGCHFNEFAGVSDVDYTLCPSEEMQYDWLKTYLETYRECNSVEGAVSEAEIQTLYVQVNKFGMASHFSWGLWALLQARYSTIDFDFLRYAAARFKQYFKKKDEIWAMKLP